MELERKVKVWLKDTSKVLDISDLNLKEWPDVLKGKEIRNKIVKLDCQNNQLISLPPLLPNLIELTCYNNQLTSLPLFLNLIRLWCDENKLTSLPLFPNLIYLSCACNRLTTFPLFPKLIKLFCNNNRLVSLPLPKLAELNCSFNCLTSLPLLPKLDWLMCMHNRLTFLPVFPKLTELMRSENLFTPRFLSERYGNNALFSDKLTSWKKVWRLKTIRSNEIRSRGLDKVIKVLKNRLYLPRLNSLEQELVYSPNHPGKFYKNLRIGDWSSKPKKLTNLTTKTN